MQGYNKYYPPDYDGKSSINQLVGTHALGKRARKIDKGILVVRFELPYDVYCISCEKRLTQGTRYNAEKKKSGSYYTTPIWSFKFKCQLCSGEIDIHTDPKNTDYKIEAGARRTVNDELIKVERSESTATDGQNPFAEVEKERAIQMKQNEDSKFLKGIYESNLQQWDDPYRQSQKLRHNFREEKRILKEKEKEKKKLQDKFSISIPLVEGNEADSDDANQIEFDTLTKTPESALNDRMYGSVFEHIKDDDFQRDKGNATVNTIRNIVRQSSDNFTIQIKPKKRIKAETNASEQSPATGGKRSLVEYDDSD